MTQYEVMDKTPSRFAACGTSMKYLAAVISERETQRACIEYLNISLRR